MKFILLYGSLGSGKSTAGKYFTKLGFNVLDVDSINRQLQQTKAVQQKIMQAFGPASLSNNSINTKYLRNVIFNNIEAKSYLESIMHPLIMQKIKSVKLQKNTIIMSGVLFKELIQKQSVTILVKAKLSLQLKRAAKRDNCSLLAAAKIIKLQNFDSILEPTYCIDNSFGKINLRTAVEKIAQKISAN